MAAAVATLCTTKPVSGGELKLVESRSMLPSGLCERSRNCAARRIRSRTSGTPRCFECGAIQEAAAVSISPPAEPAWYIR